MKNLITIGAIVKNEGPYILEWLAWHRVIGVKNFIIADNNSSDGSNQILSQLAASGFINLIHFPGEKNIPPQIPAYMEIIKISEETTEWLAFIDADEFLYPEEGFTIQYVIESSDSKDGAIGINWAIYGSSGREKPGDGLVVERFISRGTKVFGPNRHYKSIIRLSALTDPIEINNPHHFKILEGYRYINTEFREITFAKGPSVGLSDEVVWGKLRLNHYVIKSWLEFWMKKVARGRATTFAQRDENFFKKHDRNEVSEIIPSEMINKVLNEVLFLKSHLKNLPNEIINLDKKLTEIELPESIGPRPK